jgi:hypothetical protein
MGRVRVQDIIRISPHWRGDTYNVDLLSAMGRGEYMAVGKEFDVTLEVAEKSAERLCRIYQAVLEKKGYGQ